MVFHSFSLQNLKLLSKDLALRKQELVLVNYSHKVYEVLSVMAPELVLESLKNGDLSTGMML